MNTTTTTKTPRTIEQILDLRLRAAKLRVAVRAVALAKETNPGNTASTTTGRRAELDASFEQAELEVVRVQREVDAQKGLDVGPVAYVSSSSFDLGRYVALLMVDNSGLDPEAAWAEAFEDERARFDDWDERYGEHGDE